MGGPLRKYKFSLTLPATIYIFGDNMVGNSASGS